ncbi:glycosyltransferase family 4 protein [Microbacterium sp. ARD31]|uniref:glycosyltransferase family 4 protein n=1 Tax=Microbacterium sp. ARD31 TaxID=2962576 RepID=UPI002881403C|nr:glycosyltransferase family 4 protein [Microbacterium sp. ARD31]MDT0186478.1 glycosyltransferase family 4 protein [Microbacterium sp. ARD31]
MHVVQLAQHIGPGSGVAGVAYNLERQFRAMGHTVEQFTLRTAGWRERPWPRNRHLRALAMFRRTIWFSTVGTMRARRFLAARPRCVSICHGAPLAGHVYVNHGVVSEAMRSRGHGLLRMIQNPTHPFTYMRDFVRYHSSTHRVVVALSPSERVALLRAYGRIKPSIEVIPNGVEPDVYRPPTVDERRSARAAFALDDEARVALFVGHEFGRKGLDSAIESLVHAPTVLLLVAGGETPEWISWARDLAEQLGVAQRVLLMGPRTDLELFFAASDMLVLPSHYEPYGLVILEALASGLPVISTAVGCAPEVIEDGVNGFLVGRDPEELGRRMEQIGRRNPGGYADDARRTVAGHDWRAVATKYLALLNEVRDRSVP